MIFRNSKLLTLFILLSLVTPLTASANSADLWQKLPIVANDDWSNTDVISSEDIKQLTSLAESGDANSQFALGAIQLARQNHYEAQHWLMLAAVQGHLPARYKYAEASAGYNVADLGW